MIDIKRLSEKPLHRLRGIREKYRRLMWTSHDGGAGGVKDSDEFRQYNRIVREIDKIIRERG